MHAFLIFCVLAEAGFIGLLLWNARRQAIGADAVNEWLDLQLKARDEFEDRINQALANAAIVKLDERHSDLVRQVEIGNDEKNVRLKALSDLIGIQAELLNVFDAKVSDLAEGCAKLDADLSEASEDVRECVKLRQSDLAGLNERITEIADAQEKSRRKSGARNAPAGYESLRGGAEVNARKFPDPGIAKLVALAEGGE